jgi:predicted lipase
VERLFQDGVALTGTKVFVTGHSLGAAMAVLCAAGLGAGVRFGSQLNPPLELGEKIGDVYTFGQPRVGNKAFYDWYATAKHNSWRVTHYKDIIPHVPPQNSGFHHTSTLLFFFLYFIVILH